MVREGCAAGAMPAPSTHQSPFLQAAFLAALFYARRTVKSETSNTAGGSAPTSDLGQGIRHLQNRFLMTGLGAKGG